MKKIFKAISSLALTAMLACSVIGAVGCGGSTTSDVDEEGNTVIKIAFHVDKESAEGKAYAKRISAFNTAYKDQKIKASASYIARSAGATDYETTLINQQNSNKLADIITFDAPNCASYAQSKLIYDISNIVPSSVKSDFITVNEYQGKLYGLPIQESSAGFFYNKALFAQAGIDASGYTAENPWTFAQFKEVCGKLKSAGITPVDMRMDATQDEMATYLLYPFIYAAGGSFVSEDGYTATGYFNSQESKKGFQFLKDLVTEGYTSYAIGATDFFTGSVGMYLSSGWTIPDIDSKYTSTFPDRNSWGLLPYPQDVQKASATGSWSYAITNNHHKDKSKIKELLLWMVTPESSKVITDATGMIPARRSVETNYEAGSPEDVLMKQLQSTGVQRPVTVGYPAFSSNFRSVIYGLGDNDLTTLLNARANDIQDRLDVLASRN
ncbi:MAG: extracellular solute-binding protein [Clostridia bacterium]|nr:extracellular solute-binding protein [Clostridia bacterium]